jgi:peptidoglycan LD-endopeptidase LytH
VPGALAAVLAGVVIGTWFRPAPTTHTTHTTPAASETMPPAPATVRSSAPVLPPAAEPAPNTDATPTTPATSASPPEVSDLPRLRARSLALPVGGVSAAQLSDTYTQARAAGSPHEAIDIMAPRGTPVLAVEDGPVAKLFLSKPGGITLYQFDPDSHYAYYYAHLDRYAEGVTEGVMLRKGQVIGYVGSTGNASPDAPHLHFAIFKLGPEKQWWRGTPLNPFLVWREAGPSNRP